MRVIIVRKMRTIAEPTIRGPVVGKSETREIRSWLLINRLITSNPVESAWAKRIPFLTCQVSGVFLGTHCIASPLNWDRKSPRAIIRTIARAANDEMKIKYRFYELSAFLPKIEGILSLRSEIHFFISA